MTQMDEFEMLTCPTPLKLNILYGYLFDSGDLVEKDNCTSKLNQNIIVIKEITNDLKLICSSGSNCQITKSFIINSKGDYSKIDCLSSQIIWNCESSKSIKSHSVHFLKKLIYLR